jgi:hypothetical protein
MNGIHFAPTALFPPRETKPLSRGEELFGGATRKESLVHVVYLKPAQVTF